MSFIWLNLNGVQSSDGFVWQSADRFHFHYIENGKLLLVPSEVGGVVELYLDPAAKWEPPFEKEILTPSDLDRIGLNIMKAMRFMNLKFIIRRIKADF